jgi:hypothetical protein
MRRKGPYTNAEIVVARLVCGGGGILFVFFGWVLATRLDSQPAEIAAAALAFVGACLAVLGAFAPREWCVRAADWIVTTVT